MMASIRSLFLMFFTLTKALNELFDGLAAICRVARKQAEIFEREQDLENEAKVKQLELDLAALPERLATLTPKKVKAAAA